MYEYKISCSWVDVLIFYALLFGVLYRLMRFRDGSDSQCASDFVQIFEKCDGDPGNE
jgi:hypothetical protein